MDTRSAELVSGWGKQPIEKAIQQVLPAFGVRAKRVNTGETGNISRFHPALTAPFSPSAELNLLHRYGSQYKRAEENKNKTRLPLLWPHPPQVDSYCADRSTKQTYQRKEKLLPSRSQGRRDI